MEQTNTATSGTEQEQQDQKQNGEKLTNQQMEANFSILKDVQSIIEKFNVPTDGNRNNTFMVIGTTEMPDNHKKEVFPHGSVAAMVAIKGSKGSMVNAILKGMGEHPLFADAVITAVREHVTRKNPFASFIGKAINDALKEIIEERKEKEAK
jgi:hypothetical protein